MPEAQPAGCEMAFDFGTQKMGLAVGHPLTGSATPLPVFPMRDGIPDWPALLQRLAEWQPVLCVVGLPLNMDDSESLLSQRARKFARRLQHQTRLPVWMLDERLSTREGRDRQAQIRQTRKGRVPSADSLAAVALLECWFAEPVGLPP